MDDVEDEVVDSTVTGEVFTIKSELEFVADGLERRSRSTVLLANGKYVEWS